MHAKIISRSSLVAGEISGIVLLRYKSMFRHQKGPDSIWWTYGNLACCIDTRSYHEFSWRFAEITFRMGNNRSLTLLQLVQTIWPSPHLFVCRFRFFAGVDRRICNRVTTVNLSATQTRSKAEALCRHLLPLQYAGILQCTGRGIGFRIAPSLPTVRFTDADHPAKMSTPYPSIPFYGPGGLWKSKKNKDANADEAPEVRSDGDEKLGLEHVSDTSLDPTTSTPSARRRREAPPLVRDLSPDERAHLEKLLVAKIDLRLLPMLIIMYLMNYLDRNNIAAARLAGLEDELQLTGTQYLTALSILFVGYLLMQVPSNLFLNKIGKPALYLPAVMVVWGTISAATAAAQSYGGLIAIRFFLGFVEAAYFPGCLFFLSSWYTRKELGFRTAVLYSGSLMSGAFSGLITAGITGNLDGKRGLRAWRWLFIIEGVITIFIAFIAFFILPNFPRTTSWLTENERQLAIWRLDEDIGEDDWTGSQTQTFWHGMRLAFSDLKMWVLVCHVVSHSVPTKT